MIEPKDPIKPTGGTTPPDHSHGTSGTSKKNSRFEDEYGKMAAKPMKFLGMQFTGPEASKLWAAIMQQINTQIQQDQKRALKAIRKLKKSTTDQD